MKSVREWITPFVYDRLKTVLDLIDKDGTEAKFHGISVTADESEYTVGTVIRAAVSVYIQNPTEENRKRVIRYFDFIRTDTQLGKWAKLSTLESLLMLKEAGELSLISEEKMAMLQEKTDYTDFIRKDTLQFLTPLPSNYYHVAMLCAGRREKLGFEQEGMSDRCAEKMISIMQESSKDGWMDETPPYGRFDSYSIDANLNMCNALAELGKEVPAFMRENVQRSVSLLFAARNRKGNGISYGRSLSMYGDTNAAKHMAYALTEGLLSGEDAKEAHAYILHITKKLVTFWYREEKGFCDFWTDGRATEEYREIFRIFEVYMEFCNCLISLYNHLSDTPYLDSVPEKDIKEPDAWEWHKTEFVREENKVRSLYVLRRKDHTFMLPFIGSAPHYVKSGSYMPFPHEPLFSETAPAGYDMPFLTPEVILENGEMGYPIQYFTEIEEESGEDFLKITAKGYLTKTDYVHPFRQSEHTFCAVYTFCGDRITIEYNIEKGYLSRMLFAGTDVSYVTFSGAEREEMLDVSDNPGYHTPHGGLTVCKMAFFRGKTCRAEMQIK